MRAMTRTLACAALAAASATSHANEGHRQLMSLNEADRNRRLSELLVRMPETCVVQRHLFRGLDKQGAALWSAECANKKAYVIRVLDDAKGSTQIMDCKVFLERAKVDCFSKP